MFSFDITGPAGQAPLREWPGEVGVRRVAGGYHAQGPGGAAAAVDCGLGRDRGDAEVHQQLRVPERGVGGGGQEVPGRHRRRWGWEGQLPGIPSSLEIQVLKRSS